MASLALARELLDNYAKLDTAVQKRVHDPAEKCRLLSMADLNRSKGLHLEVIDAGALAEHVESATAAPASDEPGTALFAHRRDKDFTQVGVDEALLPVVRIIQDERQLEALITTLPQGQPPSP